MNDATDALMSMQAAVHDIDRWLLQAIVNARLSRDRQGDIIRAAKRVIALSDRVAAIAMARGSAETLAAPVPQDCQARAVGIAGNDPA